MFLQLTNLFSIIILIAFGVRTIRNLLYHLFIWQLKEYRLDRMLVYFKTKQGSAFLFGPLSLIKTILFITLLIAFFLIRQSTVFNIVVWLFDGLIFLEAINNLKQIYKHQLPLPKMTFKIKFIIVVILLINIVIIRTTTLRLALVYLPFLDKSLGFLVAAFIGLFSLPGRIRNLIFQWLAQDRLEDMPNLKVIGITGSYGKTSTKDFIYQILKSQYKVVKTPANINTLIGIARTILRSVDKKTEYFIVEAGAYKKGEIRQVARLVKNNLSIGIITGLNQQHLDLFGSFENIMASKYELIKELPIGATAIFNGNNESTLRLSEKAKKNGFRVLLYGTKNKRIAAYASKIRVDQGILNFQVVIGKHKGIITVPFLGIHHVENILAAMLVAVEAGVSWDKIISTVKQLKASFSSLTFQKKAGKILINDTYNSNPDGVKAAFRILRGFKGKKVLILQPLIELGLASAGIHEEIGKNAGEICEGVILTNKNFNVNFIKGFRNVNNDAKIIITREKEAFDSIEKNWPEAKVLLFEGREAGKILKYYV